MKVSKATKPVKDRGHQARSPNVKVYHLKKVYYSGLLITTVSLRPPNHQQKSIQTYPLKTDQIQEDGLVLWNEV